MLVFKRDEAYIFQFDEALDDNLTGTSCICQFKKKLCHFRLTMYNASILVYYQTVILYDHFLSLTLSFIV